MTPFETLSTACNGAREVVLVAPYARSSAVKRLPLTGVGQLSVYLRGAAADFISGASDLELLQYVASLGGNVYVCPTLHAKYYRADRTILIGSANLSDRGLGLAKGRSNLEILASPDLSFDWEIFETNLSRESTLVTPNFHEKVRESFDTVARTGLAIPSPDQLTGWIPQAAHAAYVWDGYSGQMEHVPLEVQREAVSRDLEAIKFPKDLPKLAFDAWLRAILLTAPSTSPVIVAYLNDTIASFANETPFSQRTLTWWKELTVGNIP